MSGDSEHCNAELGGSRYGTRTYRLQYECTDYSRARRVSCVKHYCVDPMLIECECCAASTLRLAADMGGASEWA